MCFPCIILFIWFIFFKIQIIFTIFLCIWLFYSFKMHFLRKKIVWEICLIALGFFCLFPDGISKKY